MFALANQKPAYHNPTGKKVYIMNMYTAPEYRRQGIAFNTLYESYGFVKMEDEMELI